VVEQILNQQYSNMAIF